MDEQLKSLLSQHMVVMLEHTDALKQQNDLLMQIVAQNADLLSHMAFEEQGSEDSVVDLAGRPLT